MTPPSDSIESREGLVSVYNHEGEYVGCLGTETWQWTLDGGIEKLKERAEAAEARVEVGRDLRRAAYERIKELQAEAKALREALDWIAEFAAKMTDSHTGFVHVKRRARAALAASESSDGGT